MAVTSTVVTGVGWEVEVTAGVAVTSTVVTGVWRGILLMEKPEWSP